MELTQDQELIVNVVMQRNGISHDEARKIVEQAIQAIDEEIMYGGDPSGVVTDFLEMSIDSVKYF